MLLFLISELEPDSAPLDLGLLGWVIIGTAVFLFAGYWWSTLRKH